MLINIACMSAVCTTIKIADIADNIVGAIGAASPVMRYSRHIIPNGTVTQIQIIAATAKEMTFQVRIRSVQADINCTVRTIIRCSSRNIAFYLQIIISGINSITFGILLHIQVNQSLIACSPDGRIIMGNNAAAADINSCIIAAGKQGCAILYINIYKSFNFNRVAVFLFSAVLSIYFNSAPVQLITRSINAATNLHSMLLAVIIIDNNMCAGFAYSSCRCPDSTAIIIVISRGNANSAGVVNRDCTITVSTDSRSGPHRLTAGRA